MKLLALTGSRWVYDHSFYIVLNFAVSEAGFPGSTDAKTPTSGKMWVDYVRFFNSLDKLARLFCGEAAAECSGRLDPEVVLLEVQC